MSTLETSLFPDMDSFIGFKTLVEVILKYPEANGLLGSGNQGYYNSGELLSCVKSMNPGLAYVQFEHLVELYLRKGFPFLIDIKGKAFGYSPETSGVDVPDTLYFGTLNSILPSIDKRGLTSSGSRPLRLFTTPDLARESAENFAKNANKNFGDIAVVSVDAKAAQDFGLKFLASLSDGEFRITHVPRAFCEVI